MIFLRGVGHARKGHEVALGAPRRGPTHDQPAGTVLRLGSALFPGSTSALVVRKTLFQGLSKRFCAGPGHGTFGVRPHPLSLSAGTQVDTQGRAPKGERSEAFSGKGRAPGGIISRLRSLSWTLLDSGRSPVSRLSAMVYARDRLHQAEQKVGIEPFRDRRSGSDGVWALRMSLWFCPDTARSARLTDVTKPGANQPPGGSAAKIWPEQDSTRYAALRRCH